MEIHVNKNISTIINSVLQIQIPHFFPYLCMIFNYLFEFIPSSIHHPLIIENFIGLLNAIDYTNYNEDIKSFLHTLRNLIELLDEDLVLQLFTSHQLNTLLSIIKSIEPQIHLEDKEGFMIIKSHLIDFSYLLTNKTNPTFLF